TFGTSSNLTVNLQNTSGSPGRDAINVTGAQLKGNVGGSGAIDLECSQSISISAGAALETWDGNITLMANQQATPTSGNFIGVYVDGAGTQVQILDVFSNGTLTIKGRGGNDAAG